MQAIHIIASYATDTVRYLDGAKRHVRSEKRSGGPAFWIERTLSALHCEYVMHTGSRKAEVSITVHAGEETGHIKQVYPIPFLSSQHNNGLQNLFLISTIADEFDITSVKHLRGIVAVDMQGFVRAHYTKQLEKTKTFELFALPDDVLHAITIMKVTESESKLISKKMLNDQKRRVLLITKGKKGFVAYANGKKYVYAARKMRTVDTLGAGDTFLASFSARYLANRNVVDASLFAKEYAEKFLLEKTTYHSGIKNLLPGSIINLEAAKASKNDILFLTYVHGNEPIGYELIKKLQNNKKTHNTFDWLIANPPAVFQGKRYVDVDLNRVAPGDTDSPDYERRRAHELMGILAQYKYVIDVHQTRTNSRSIVILPHPSFASLSLVSHLDVRDVLIWPAPKDAKTSSIIQPFPYSLGLEIGTKSGYAQMLKRLNDVCAKFLLASRGKQLSVLDAGLAKKRFFYVYGKIKPDEVQGLQLKDFQRVQGAKGSFVALLFGKHQKLIGYKMREVDNHWIKSYISKRS